MEAVNCTSLELSTYLQGLAEDYLPIPYSDTNAYVPLKSIAIASKSWRHGKKTGLFHGFQFSMTSEISTADRGEELLTSWPAASPARTLAAQGKGPEWTESKAASGEKWSASFAKLDLNTSSWKTAQFSLHGDLAEFLETWPRFGSMRNGACWERTPWEHHISERGFGLLPTPSGTSNHGKNHVSGRLDEWGGSRNRWRGTEIGKVHCPAFEEWMMGWPVQWTELTPYETAKFHEWQQEHSIYSADKD